MAFSIPTRPTGSCFSTILNSYACDPGAPGPFASVLTEEKIREAAVAAGVDLDADEACSFTTEVTIWAWLTQCLSGAKSCVVAVARVMVLEVAMELDPCAAGTSAYCKARQRQSEAFICLLAYQVGDAVEDQAPQDWRWHQHRVVLVDGSSAIADDTEANQAEYPQPSTQRRGVGFASLRFVVLLAFATGTLVGASFGRYAGKETGETALFRKLFDRLRAGDITVADRYYCSYFMIVLLKKHGVDVVFRLHQKRRYDFRRGQRLGHGDHIVEWERPPRPRWMDAATYATIPLTLTVREVRFSVATPGCRSHSIIVATTLLDSEQYKFEDIADLYHKRWNAELDLRSIKQTLGIDHIHCKTPAMIRKSLWMHFLAYNLVRKVAAQAAWAHGLKPRQISFAGTVQTLEAFRWLLIASEDDKRPEICHHLLVAIATHQVGHRPDRKEPRRLKRRRDRYRLLRMPRAQAREAAINGTE